MQRWFVQCWPFTTSPFDWPTHRGFIIASNRAEAIENARVLFHVGPTHIVHTYSECDFPIQEMNNA